MASLIDETATGVIASAPLEIEQPVIVESEESKTLKQQSKKKSPSEKAALAPEQPENSYVSVVSKKIRNLKKKLEKIREIETKRDQGKKINEQQIEALSRKDEMLRLQAEYESIRQQLVEVQSQELVTPKPETETSVQIVEAPVQAPTPVEEPTSASVTEKSSLESELEGAKRLLSLFHTVSLHMGLGKELPSALDFFRRVLLGSTRPPEESSFIENLNESVSEAKKYLYRENREVAQGLTYAQLEDAVNDIIAKAQPTEISTDASLEEVEVEGGFQFIQEPVEVAQEQPVEPVQTIETPQVVNDSPDDIQPDEMPAAEDIVDALIDEVVVDPTPVEASEDLSPRGSDGDWQKNERNQRNSRSRGGRPRHNSGKEGRQGGDRRPRRPQHSEGKDSDAHLKSDGQWRQQPRGGQRGGHQKAQQRKENDNTSSNGPISRQRSDPIPAAH